MEKKAVSWKCMIDSPAIPATPDHGNPTPIVVGNARFTFLTERLVRCEWAENEAFVDGCTQTVVARDFAPVSVAVEESEEAHTLHTAHLSVRFRKGATKFSADSLEIRARDGTFSWKHGTPNTNDLPGTLRTLDNALGMTHMMTGERHRLCGSLISRAGWTGFSWNPDYFPDARAFFEEIHAKGVRVCLNLHPHEGVAPHEAAYDAVCARLGIDQKEGRIIPFQLANEDFLRAYFEELLHPLEADGVDFWWIDWQQGERWDLPDVDPLWYLNHLHARDLARDGRKRSLIFSRWGDHGSHRYPVGFSGDTYAAWETLAVLPYFTAASANLGYGWRSDETGGFHRGINHVPERLLRWCQFACFSPTFRLHNCGDPGMDYLPWHQPAEIREAMIAAMRLRAELLPYIYTAAHTHATGGPCLSRPMYQDFPDAEAAYLVPQQYLFGPDMIGAPFTAPRDHHTRYARQVVWLPEGRWFDFFSGVAFEGGRFHVVYGGLGDIPVFVRAGAVIPLARNGATRLCAFPGEGVSYWYDDDGTSLAWEQGAFRRVRLCQRRGEDGWRVDGEKADGDWPMGELPPVEFVEVRPRSFDRTAAVRTLLNFRILGTTIRPMIGKPNMDFDPAKEPYPPLLEEILEDPAKLLPFLAEFTPSQARCLFELITDSGFHAQDLHDQRVALIYWCGNRSTGSEARVAVSERFQYTNAGALWEPAKGHAWLCHDCASPYTVWKAHVSYGALFSYTEGSGGTGSEE